MREFVTYFLYACLFSLLTACGQSPLIVPPSSRLPERVELSSIPFYPQSAYQSAPAALAIMLNQRGVLTTPGFLQDQVHIPGREGSRQGEVSEAARAHDMLVYPLKPQIEDLLAEVAAGNPVLLLQNLGYDWYPKWHFAVLVGYDRREQTLVMRSGSTRRLISDFSAFDQAWKRAGRWAVVTVPADTLPVTVEPGVWLKAASDLDGSGRKSAAQRAFRTATERWPTRIDGWLALARSRQAGADLLGAQEALLAGLKQQPTSAEGWFALTEVFSERGCIAAAGRARQCAQRLAPTDGRVLGNSEQGSPRTLCATTISCPLD
jgi:tetratricopeptide (TPR) repeat protein